MSVSYARVRSWARGYPRFGAWWHVGRRGFTLRYRDRLLLVTRSKSGTSEP